ncbi:MobF family relaxase [Chamaesiphon minutus]|uniref:Conjugative relaxase domain protein, TrwC/TraI family n=1 Tax=Chamaesiphon minutus (strain ATCC 27169 / PCC 6605) TaxID=1173020 RepID=K9UQ70_CHAP6|nr:MobF family relaxase [Chamaesiphon minutus]AFY96813.1 conjugative relaxase domain protein, TrwC/TraI family [Chamaesiphon minutus PCC 6605]
MLTAKNCSGGGAVKYFTEYYERDETRWYGKGASALGLEGEIERESFENVCYGKSPDGSRYLGTKGDPEKRRAGTDFTFSAPKSVSLTALVGGDTRLEIAHRVAVEKTLALIEERYAQTRITSNKNVIEVKTGNLVVAQFDHIESRELDPHLHTHALVMNLTQAENGKWYANDNDLIFQNKKHLGTIYQAYLAAEVERLGYEIEHRPHGQFEIKGYDRQSLVDFSKRRMQILSECPGNSTWQTREDTWHRTRKDKERIPSTELKVKWQQEAADLGIEIVRSGLAKDVEPTAAATKDRYIEDAIAHCSERSVDFRVEEIEKFAIAQRLPIDIAEIKPLCDDRADLIRLDGSYTTFRALCREEKTISLMRQGQGTLTPVATTESVTDYLRDTTLNAGQRQAVRLAATNADRAIAWQGVAGAGKTYALAELKQIADSQEVEVKGFAPSAEAAKVLGDELGIETNTVARKLCSREELPSKDELWIVDEAGLLSADDALALLSRATKEQARVLLVGDTRQLSSVAAGNPFKSLQAAGMATARLTVSLRQKDPNLKAAVDALADGAIERGFTLLEQNNNIVTIAKDDIIEKIASEYLALTPAEQAKTLIVSGTNDTRREITAAIREGFRDSGTIGLDLPARQLVDYKFTKIENRYVHNYNVGDIVVPIRNYKRLEKGQSYVVAGKEADDLVLRSPEGERLVTDLSFDKAHYHEESIGIAVGDRLRWSKNDTQLQRRNGQEFEIESTVEHLANIKYRDGRTEAIDLRQAHHFDLAIATTIYSSQGKTSERVFVAADGVQNSESFYVAASRARSELKIFTDSPDNLRSMAMDSMSNSNPRELLSELHKRQAVLKAEKQRGIDNKNVVREVDVPVEISQPLNLVKERESDSTEVGVTLPTEGGGVILPTQGGDEAKDLNNLDLDSNYSR